VVPGSDVLRKYLDSQTVRRILKRTTEEPRDRRLQVLLWQMLGFHFWHKLFIESERVDAENLQVETLVQ